MTAPLGELDVQTFLHEYWQKRPCLLRQAFPGFAPELDENDVAGLACDDMAEARLITGSYPRQDWRVVHGPFTARELRKLPDSNWTLLVQDAEKHYPPLASVLARFSFLPTWRLDDLMISVAATGGSVGPHFDQYDVFLLQASGRRCWQIASCYDPTLLADIELKVLASFTPEQEWILEPGDMLYLPPGVAHHGVALDTGMTWSIGLRAPSQADLLQALGEWLAERHNEGQRYADGVLAVNPRPGEISPQAIAQLIALISHPLDAPGQLNSFLASFLSRYRLAQQPAPPAQALNENDVTAALAGSARLQRNPWTRLAWIEQNGMALLSAAGDEYTCSIATAMLLCAIPAEGSGDMPMDGARLQLVCQLINEGHLFLAQ
jgi:50S ribosomal protein L16 3-hydroxylase